jgi:hypothetical protein
MTTSERVLARRGQAWPLIGAAPCSFASRQRRVLNRRYPRGTRPAGSTLLAAPFFTAVGAPVHVRELSFSPRQSVSAALPRCRASAAGLRTCPPPILGSSSSSSRRNASARVVIGGIHAERYGLPGRLVWALRSGLLRRRNHRQEPQQLGHDPLVRVLLEIVAGVRETRDLGIWEGA